MKGQGRVTSHDVAKLAGVSRSVVSAVLNGTPGIGVSGEKRRAVLKAIDELGYRVDAQARAMRTGKSYCIAAFGSMGGSLFLQALEGMQTFCRAKGYHILLYGAEGGKADRSGLVDLFLQRRIDGIVTNDTTSYSDPDWSRLVREHRIPYVSVEGYPDDSNISSVLMDYFESMHRALDYLWQKTGVPPVYLALFEGKSYRPNWGDIQRLNAYTDWMRRHGLPETVLKVNLSNEPSAVAEWLSTISRLSYPLSVLSNWSRGAVAVYQAAYAMNLKIGRDVFVMAADNTERVNAHLSPTLTAVEVPYLEMGAAAAERLIEYAEGSRSLDDTSDIWIEAKLEERDSV